ncbi:MAG: DUF2752 domain-containing protein [Clostridia bacterium]|uniref:DUF2752 domain-containing protein n=1 Tax=Bianquea renquensis TaxID=2763661 RepID=A0A926DSV2_9FIRM|nr:DUF2752 domain-containing protein [Bianquea renquensis]MBC8544660.1 DUF2752 domain-containing protein [Bianquea renquensis]
MWKTWARNVCRRFGLWIGLAIYVLVFRGSCVIRLLTGIPCPGCGLSRAYLALLHGHIADAFYYHPLFFTVVPFLLYMTFYDRLSPRVGKKVETVACICLSAAFILVYIGRMVWGDGSVLSVDLESGMIYRILEAGRSLFG